MAGIPPPVDPRIGNASVRSGRRPAELVVAIELELEIVGWGSLEGIAPPVEATKALDEVELLAAGLDSIVELEEKVGCGSLEGMPPPVEPSMGSASERSGRRPAELVVAVELEAPVRGPWNPLIAREVVLVSSSAVVDELDAVGWTTLLGMPTDGV